jgi:hypothetical protein
MTAFESTTSRLLQQEVGACALIQDLLPLYTEGEVTPASRDLIAEHLEHCERCTGFLAGARSTREQLRRDTTLRETSVAQDWAARQAIIVGQRRVMAVVLGVFGVLCLVMVVGVISIGLFKPPGAPAPVPPAVITEGAMDPPVITDGAMDPSEEQPLEDELHRRAMEEAGLLYWDPRTNQFIEQNPGPSRRYR